MALGFELVVSILVIELAVVAVLLLPLPSAVIGLLLTPLRLLNNFVAYIVLTGFGYFVYDEVIPTLP